MCEVILKIDKTLSVRFSFAKIAVAQKSKSPLHFKRISLGCENEQPNPDFAVEYQAQNTAFGETPKASCRVSVHAWQVHSIVWGLLDILEVESLEV